ncbi:hypothetical protein GCM10023093_08470 [Nemorincola caseinilytica]|uniref:Cytochrome B n=1 Tax=Nemorincola caseinilytica TaxID=2054315 RepID=A0ABP8N6U4_9BACT
MLAYLDSFNYLHSILRYFILFFAVIVVLQSIVGMLGKRKFKKVNKQMALLLLIFCDLQLLIGGLLYYYKVIGGGVLSAPGLMKDTYRRFYGVEHAVAMVLAILLVHVGYSVTKRNIDDDRKFKRLFWCSFLALVIFMAMIPWPGKQLVGRPMIPTMTH